MKVQVLLKRAQWVFQVHPSRICWCFIPFHGWILFCVWLYHIFLVHSSVDGYLGCFFFLLLWIIMLWILVCKFLCGYLFSFLLGVYPGVKSLGHMVTLTFNLWRTARLFSKVAASFYIPTSSVRAFQFLHILSNTCYYLPSWLKPSYGYEVLSHCGFDLHLPDG